MLSFWTEHALFSHFSELGACNFVKHDDWDWSDPRTLLAVPSPLLSVSSPLRVFSWRPACCRQVTPGKLGCGLPLRGHRGPDNLFAPQSLLSGVLKEAGVTPAVHLCGPAPLAASPTQPVGESGKVLAELAVSR